MTQAVLVCILLAMLYVLSFGPVGAWYETRMIDNKAVGDATRTVYAPLLWLADRSEVVGNLADAYINLCEIWIEP